MFIAIDIISDMSTCLSLYVHVLPCFVVFVLVIQIRYVDISH